MSLLEGLLILFGTILVFWVGFGMPLQLLEAHAKDKGYSPFWARTIAGLAMASWPGYIVGVGILRWRENRRVSR